MASQISGCGFLGIEESRRLFRVRYIMLENWSIISA